MFAIFKSAYRLCHVVRNVLHCFELNKLHNCNIIYFNITIAIPCAIILWFTVFMLRIVICVILSQVLSYVQKSVNNVYRALYTPFNLHTLYIYFSLYKHLSFTLSNILIFFISKHKRKHVWRMTTWHSEASAFRRVKV